jgi:hypothetical protein
LSIRKIWFPQIEIESSGSQDMIDIVVVDTLCKFYELFGISADGVFASKSPLTATHNMDQEIIPDLFNLPALIESLNKKKTIWVFGTFSSAQIEECSIQELGFNLFNLPKKIFNYIPLIPSPGVSCFELLLSFNTETNGKGNYPDTIKLLRWSECHKACLEIQDPFGHGSIHGPSRRDLLQTDSCQEILNRLIDLKSKHEKKWNDLPCGTYCRLLQKMNEIIKSLQRVPNKNEKCPGPARPIAFLDCREYRVAQSRCIARLYPKRSEKFKKIIILEDNDKFRERLKNDLRQFVEDDKNIIEADTGISWSNYSLCKVKEENKNKKNENEENEKEENVKEKNIKEENVKEKNKKIEDILGKIFEDKTIEPGEVLACFDLELGKENIPETAMGDFIKNVFGGQWILYKTACKYPGIPRLVITGYRSQDISSYIAGGSAFLMKPYTPALLIEQIKQARRSVRRRVAWLCPKNIQQNYSDFLKPINVTFGDTASLLKEWLDGKQVDLDIERNVIDFVDTDLVIIDIFEIEPIHGHPTRIFELREIIRKIRAQNPGVQFILVLPFDLERETAVSGYYTRLPLNFHEGTDNVIRKPFWLVLDGKTNPDECLGDMILQQLEHKGNFDVKYQVLVPLAPIVGRLVDRFDDILKEGGKTCDERERYAPLLPYLVNVFGLSGRISDIAEPGNYATKQLLEKIKEEIEKDDRWKNITNFDDSISKILDGFLKALKSSKINSHFTLESWLRNIVDNKPGKILNKEEREDIHTLIEPLARVFGGSTRYEFSVRGSWYKGAKRIDDILIVVEFCARSSIIGRKFIRETAVKYLSKVAGEDVVLVQEIPIKGFMWK